MATGAPVVAYAGIGTLVRCRYRRALEAAAGGVVMAGTNAQDLEMRDSICHFLERMANDEKWRSLADTDEIRHFVSHAVDYIGDGSFVNAYMGDMEIEQPIAPAPDTVVLPQAEYARLVEALEMARPHVALSRQVDSLTLIDAALKAAEDTK